MRKYLLASSLILALCTATPGFSANSCTLNFSVADYGTVYDQLRYNFIPFSSVQPKENGGAQFFVNINGAWIAATPVRWKNVSSVIASNSTNCSSLFKNGVGEKIVQVGYADFTSSVRDTPPTSGAYCLNATVGALSNSQVINIPQLGPNNGYWQPC